MYREKIDKIKEGVKRGKERGREKIK